MNIHTHRTIFNRSRGCLMAVAETAKSSAKASGGNRASRKARSALCSGGMWLQANQGEGYAASQLVAAAQTHKNNAS